MNSRSCLQKKAMKCSHCSFSAWTTNSLNSSTSPWIFSRKCWRTSMRTSIRTAMKRHRSPYTEHRRERNSHSTSQSSILRSTTSSSWHPGHGVSWACRNNTVRRCMLHGHSTERKSPTSICQKAT